MGQYKSLANCRTSEGTVCKKGELVTLSDDEAKALGPAFLVGVIDKQVKKAVSKAPSIKGKAKEESPRKAK